MKRGNPHITAIHVAGLYGRGLKRITPWGTYAEKTLDLLSRRHPDRVLEAGARQVGQSSSVYTIEMDGTGLVQLTHETGGEINAGADSWSPDGRKIAYVSNKSGTYQIWTMNSDGSEATQLTKGGEAHLASWGSHP